MGKRDENHIHQNETINHQHFTVTLHFSGKIFRRYNNFPACIGKKKREWIFTIINWIIHIYSLMLVYSNNKLSRCGLKCAAIDIKWSSSFFSCFKKPPNNYTNPKHPPIHSSSQNPLYPLPPNHVEYQPVDCDDLL